MKAIYIVCMVALLGAMMVMPAAATTWYVHEGESIQAAIESASEGDTIFVYNGTYSSDEYIYLHKPNITLRGEGADIVTFSPTSGSQKIYIGNPGNPNLKAPGCIIEEFKFVIPGALEVRSDSPDCIIKNSVFEGGNLAIKLAGTNTTFENNVVSNFSYELGGVEIAAPTNFRNNVVRGSTGMYGAVDIVSDNSTVTNNTIVGNTGAGILLMTATSPVANNIITKNNISSNGYGFIFYEAGSGNKIYLNDVVGSAVTATTFGSTPPSVTYWNSTEPIEYTYNGTTYTDYLGNYWSDYSGADGDGNGIGDTSHVLPESLGVDYRPLMAKFENYPAPAPPVTPTPMPLPVSSGVSLGATIRPAISLVVAPDALDFGELAAGQTSGAHTLTLSNTGGYGISVTAEVNDTASNLFVNGVLLDSNAWSAYSASIASGGSKPAGASLKVPGDYAGVGAKEGTLVFWAEMS